MRALEPLRAALGQFSMRCLDRLFPPYCRHCGAPGAERGPFCASCYALLPCPGPECRLCAAPVALDGALCDGCDPAAVPYDALVSSGEYEGAWRAAILRFKHLGDAELRSAIGNAMAREVRARGPSFGEGCAVVPVAGHALRTLFRGRDPVDELAADLARALRLPCERLLVRALRARSQGGLPRAARLLNPSGSYCVRRRLFGFGSKKRRVPSTVLLVDDVRATGATLRECARALKEAGALRVWAVVAAHSTGADSRDAVRGSRRSRRDSRGF